MEAAVQGSFRNTGPCERVVSLKPADRLGDYRVVFIPDWLSSDRESRFLNAL
jgi:hypothetical protein